MRIPPLDVIVEWPRPNYENPEHRGPAGEVVSIILLAFVTIILVIRIYSRKVITLGFAWDDVLILLAYIPTTAFTAIGLVGSSRFGWGSHVWDVRPELFPVSRQLGLASHILFDLATSFTKLSMLALIYRLACESSKTLRVIVFTLMVFISSNCVLFIVISLLQCRPLHDYWTFSFEPQNCLDEATHLLIAGVINTTTDFLVVLIPLTIIRRLHSNRKLPSRQAIVVTALFAAGFLASAAGAARTYFTWLLTSSRDHDSTWHSYLTWLTSSIELHVGIMAASIPATKPFFMRYVPRLWDSAVASGVAWPRSRARSSVKEGTASSSESRATWESMSTMPGSEEEDGQRSRKLATGEEEEAPPRIMRYSDLNKPLPIVRKQSLHTISIKLDVNREGGHGGRGLRRQGMTSQRRPREPNAHAGGKVDERQTFI